jgi:DNA repair exonuclease SbcCD ATPase subunit
MARSVDDSKSGFDKKDSPITIVYATEEATRRRSLQAVNQANVKSQESATEKSQAGPLKARTKSPRRKVTAAKTGDEPPAKSTPRKGEMVADGARAHMLMKQLEEMDRKKKEEIRQIRKETKRKKKEILKDAKAREARAKKKTKKNPDLEENHKLIGTLREDNRRVRPQIAKLEQNIENLRLNNSKLSTLDEKDGEAFRNLEAHYQHLVKGNEKLMKAKAVCKKEIKELSESIDLKTEYGSAEHRMELAHKITIRATVKLAKSGGDDSLVPFLKVLGKQIVDRVPRPRRAPRRLCQV